MKGKVIRKSLALALTSALVMTLLPVNAYAEEAENEIFFQEEASEEELQEDFSFDEELEEYDVTEDIEDFEEEVDEDIPEFEDDDIDVTEYTIGETVSDTIKKYEYKVYSFTLEAAGRVNIHTVSGGNYWVVGTELLSKDDMNFDDCWLMRFPGNETAHKGTDDNHLDLIKGTYYLYVLSGSYGAPNEIKYSFEMTFDEIVVGEDEKPVFDEDLNGSTSDERHPKEILTDTKYVAQSHTIYLKDSIASADWYVFTLKKDSRIYLSATNNQIDSLWFRFYNYDKNSKKADLINTQPCPAELNAGNMFNDYQIREFGDSLWDDGKDVIFKAGTYAMSVEKKILNDYGDSIGNTGEYRFRISTKQSVAVESVAIQNKGKTVNSIKLPLSSTATLTALVKPDKASEKSVIWEVDDSKIAEIDQKGNVTPKALGECTITATTVGVNKDNKHLSTICKVEVVEDFQQGETPVIVLKEKVDLSGEEYFNEEYDKKDKYVVTPKKLGSVKKGIFTAKKAGTVTITKKIKEGKKYVDWRTITIEIEEPKLVENEDLNILLNEKKTAFIVHDPLQEIPLDELVVCEKSKKMPLTYVAADKKGKSYEITEDGRMLNIYKAGKVKVTAYYAENKGAPFTINFTVKLPKLSKSKVTVKKGKSTTVKISGVLEDITPVWAVMEYDTSEEAWVESECAVAEVVEDTDGRKCKVYALEKPESGRLVYLIADVNGYQYGCLVKIK